MERGCMTGLYTQSDHDRAAKMGGKMLVAVTLIVLLILIMAVIA